MAVVLRAHPVRDESHIQRNTTGEVVTTQPHQRHDFRIATQHQVAQRILRLRSVTP